MLALHDCILILLWNDLAEITVSLIWSQTYLAKVITQRSNIKYRKWPELYYWNLSDWNMILLPKGKEKSWKFWLLKHFWLFDKKKGTFSFLAQRGTNFLVWRKIAHFAVWFLYGIVKFGLKWLFDHISWSYKTNLKFGFAQLAA